MGRPNSRVSFPVSAMAMGKYRANYPQGLATGVAVAASSRTLLTGSAHVSPPMSGTFTVTASGLGARSSNDPFYSQLFDPDVVNAIPIVGGFRDDTALGYYNKPGYGGMAVVASGGYLPGYGCLTTDTVLGLNDHFCHTALHIADGTRRAFQTFLIHFEHLAGTGVAYFQWKGPRASDSSEYDGLPRITISSYPTGNLSSIDFTNMGLITAAVNDGTDDNDAFPVPAYKTWPADGWFLVEAEYDFGTVGNADGFIKLWINGKRVGPFTLHTGSPTYTTDAMPLRASAGELIRYLSLFPGIDNFGTTNQYRVKIAHHWADFTPQRLVITNAPTWANSDRKIWCEIADWKGGTNPDGFWPPSIPWATPGQTVYGYGVDANNNASTATELTVPG